MICMIQFENFVRCGNGFVCPSVQKGKPATKKQSNREGKRNSKKLTLN